MKVLCTSLLAIVATVLISQTTSAQRPDGPPRDGPPRGGFRGPLILQALDADKDGTLSKEEINNATEVLKKLDKNGDGSLSREEYLGPRPPQGRPSGRGRPQGDRPDRPRGKGRPQGGRPNPEQLIKRILQNDKDGDGKISKDEAPERMKRGFDRLDTNKDGFIDKDELKKMVERFSGGRGRPQGDRPRGPRPDGERGPRKRPDAE